MSGQIRVTRDGGQAIVEIDGRDSKDMLDVEGILELGLSITKAAQDPDVKLVRIRSAGKAFCAGRKPGGPAPSSLSALAYRRAVADPILSVYRAVHEASVPILAEVAGDAIGFGCAVVAACDLAVASDAAQFSLPEMEKNLPPTLVLSVLRSRVPMKAALHLTYLGTKFDAREALRLGFVGEIVEPARVRARCDEIAVWLDSRDRVALQTMKAYQREAVVRDFHSAVELAGSLLSVAMTSQR